MLLLPLLRMRRDWPVLTHFHFLRVLIEVGAGEGGLQVWEDGILILKV